jgi:hypothetical protein
MLCLDTTYALVARSVPFVPGMLNDVRQDYRRLDSYWPELGCGTITLIVFDMTHL